MTATNDITGDLIHSKTNSDNYRDGWDRIFGSRKKNLETTESSSESDSQKKLVDESETQDDAKS